MATVKGVNVTKFDAGGSGDNVVDDGFIKSVEKVWIDSYAFGAALASSTSILIARIPANKKVTDIVVHMDPCNVTAATASSLYCGTGVSTSITPYFGKLILGGDTQLTTFNGFSASTLRLNAIGDHFGQVLPVAIGVYLTIGPSTTTAGTLRTIVRYT